MAGKSKTDLSLEDVFCIACRSILIKPVTMPCKHSICEVCFLSTIECNKLECPWDKKRFGGWVRRATKNKTLVNTLFWEQIQIQYPKEVEKRLRDEDDGIEDRIMNQEGGPSIKICEPGEVGKELLMQLKQHEEILRREREREEQASSEIIKQLQKEEEEKAAALQREQEKIAERDAELAKRLLAAENTMEVLPGHSVSATASASLVPCSTPKQGAYSKLTRNRSAPGSARTSIGTSFTSSPSEKTVVGPLDSFIRSADKGGSSKEGINQFRPIRPSPLTPTKDSPPKRLIIPQTVKPSSNSFFEPSSSDSPKTSLSFSPYKRAFAFTASSSSSYSQINAGSDSETDFEDSEESDLALQPIESSNISELKELEDEFIRSYAEISEPIPVKKPTQLQESNAGNTISMSPLSNKRLQQEREDYELAVRLQQEFDKENRAERQPVESNYELRAKRQINFSDPGGRLNKKRKISDSAKAGTKQRTIEEAFQLKS